MKETSRETLAKAEFWSIQAMNQYDHSDRRYDLVRQAYELIRAASDEEESVAYQRVLKAAGIN